MTTSFKPWLFLRLLFVAYMIYAGVNPNSNFHINWTGILVCAIIVPIIVFFSASNLLFQSEIDWSNPWSMTEPFFPMKRYPFRFWLVGAIGNICGGIASISHDLFVHLSIRVESWMLLVLGISMGAPLLVVWLSKTQEK